MPRLVGGQKNAERKPAEVTVDRSTEPMNQATLGKRQRRAFPTRVVPEFERFLTGV
jgi:hypothetical protein